MIARLTDSLRALSSLAPHELSSPVNEHLRGDCADALRLELDCPQQSLTQPQRSSLRRLSDLLEDPEPQPGPLASAVQHAHAALGLEVTNG
jgi:hypothetical protein